VLPTTSPLGIIGFDGGLFVATGPVIVTDNALDQLDSAPLSSEALARTLKVFVDPEATVQVWDALADVPELTRDVVDVVPSPQSNVYFTLFPSGSVALVE
jgi:hypothetical protein